MGAQRQDCVNGIPGGTDMYPVAMVIVLLVVAAVTWGGTAVVRQYALRTALVDIPNHRSSHVVPTPRGGGLAIVSVVLIGVLVQTAVGDLDRVIGIGLLGGGVLIATIGWVDDHKDLPARWRAVAQFAAACWFVYWAGAPESLWLGPWSIPLSVTAPVLAVVGLVWLTNLFNFMDGIDGIAGSEAASVGLVGGALLLASGMTGLGGLTLLTAAASVGFLGWNWPTARIFMGDVGSGFLGFVLGAIAIVSAKTGAVPLLVWILLLGVFVFDATATLLRRFRREKFYEAHRLHAYQRAVAAGASHCTVTSLVLVLNAALGVLATIAWLRPSAAPVMATIALGLLSVVYMVVERRRPMWERPALSRDDTTQGRAPDARP
jgi:Fuc2NAc and GlcNAc transferase